MISPATGRLVEQDQCLICMNTFEDTPTENRVILVCQHRWHSDCLNIWEERSDTCPLCRRSIEVLNYEIFKQSYREHVQKHIRRGPLYGLGLLTAIFGSHFLKEGAFCSIYGVGSQSVSIYHNTSFLETPPVYRVSVGMPEVIAGVCILGTGIGFIVGNVAYINERM